MKRIDDIIRVCSNAATRGFWRDGLVWKLTEADWKAIETVMTWLPHMVAQDGVAPVEPGEFVHRSVFDYVVTEAERLRAQVARLEAALRQNVEAAVASVIGRHKATSAEQSASGEAPSPATYAIDYDGTWTRDPEGTRAVVQLLQSRGHTCILLTGRSDDGHYGKEVHDAIGQLMPIVFAANKWKRTVATEAGYKVDIFLDDHPEYIAAQDPQYLVGRPCYHHEP